MSEQQATYGDVIPTRQVFPGEDLEQDLLQRLTNCRLTQWWTNGVFHASLAGLDGPPYQAKHHTRLGAIRLVAELMREAGVL